MKKLSNFIRDKRRELNMTQSEMAKKVKLGNPQFISNIERNISSVPLKKVKLFAQALQIDERTMLNMVNNTREDTLVSKSGVKLPTCKIDPLSVYLNNLTETQKKEFAVLLQEIALNLLGE